MLRTTPLNVTLAAAFAVCAATDVPHAASNDRVERPSVPGNLEVAAEYRPFPLAHADGTQNYICLPSGTGVAWTFFGPQATLFDGDLDQSMTHYLSPNPQEGGIPRATWRHSRDTSTVWAIAVEISTDAAFVAPGAIPWLKLQVVGRQYGPDGGRKLTPTAFIQRVNTAGGVAPASGCAASTDIGKRALMPYTTDYVFYR
jgi:Protein of unknown function (DUF3455)